MKKYYKDYKLVPKRLKNGKAGQEIEYIGSYYITRLSRTELLKKKLYCFTLMLCSSIMLILVGFLNTAGSRFVLVALPYASMFLPAVYCLMGTVRFLNSKDKLEYAVYDKSIKSIRKSSAGQIVLSGIVITGDICCLFFIKSSGKFLAEAAFLCVMIMIMVLNIILLRILKTVHYEAEVPGNRNERTSEAKQS